MNEIEIPDELLGDPTVEALALQVERLIAERDHWARHKSDCPARFGSMMGFQLSSPKSCLCGLTQARDGTLWPDGSDSVNVERAVERIGEVEEDER